MVHIARLASNEGDTIEISYEKEVVNSRHTFRGTGVPLSTYCYGKNLKVFLRLAPHRENPLRVLAEVHNIPSGSDYDSMYKIDLWYQAEGGERCYIADTDISLMIYSNLVQGVGGISRQEYNFTLLYDGYEVPLIDPVNGSYGFITHLYDA